MGHKGEESGSIVRPMLAQGNTTETEKREWAYEDAEEESHRQASGYLRYITKSRKYRRAYVKATA